MIRFLILVAIIYLLLRLVSRFFSKAKQGPKFRARSVPRAAGSGSGPTKVIDEMKACPQCGTFNPTRLAYEKKGLYFCEARCHEAYIRGEKQA